MNNSSTHLVCSMESDNPVPQRPVDPRTRRDNEAALPIPSSNHRDPLEIPTTVIPLLTLEEFKRSLYTIIAAVVTAAVPLGILLTVFLRHLINSYRDHLLASSVLVEFFAYFVNICKKWKPIFTYICLGLSTVAVGLIFSVFLSDFTFSYVGAVEFLAIPILLLLMKQGGEAKATKVMCRLIQIIFLSSIFNCFLVKHSSESLATLLFYGQLVFLAIAFWIEGTTTEADDLSQDNVPRVALLYFILGLYFPVVGFFFPMCAPCLLCRKF